MLQSWLAYAMPGYVYALNGSVPLSFFVHEISLDLHDVFFTMLYVMELVQ